MKPQSVLLALLVAVVLATVGCERSAAPQEDRQQRGEFSDWDPAVADRARLVDALPAETIAYLRLPGVWGLAAAPKDSAIGKGLDTPANREAIASLQARLPEVLAAELGPLAPVLTLLLDDLRSPLEIALVGGGPQPLEADLLIEGRFDFESVAGLDAALAKLAGQAAMLQLIEPAEGEGPGQILATMFPIFYEFDPETRRARFLTGMGASAEGLAAAYEWSVPDEHPMRAFERQIDASGHGLFLWADMARLGPMMRRGLQDEPLAQLEALGVFATRQLAMGYGSSGGKGRLAVLAEGRSGRAWELTLPPSPPTGFLTSGQADVAFGLTVPGYDWMQRLAASLGEDAETQMAGVSDRLEAEIGLDLAAVVDTFAGRMLYVDDDNGGYLVHEAADPERWPAFWDALSQRFDVRQDLLTAGDTDIHHLVIPGVDIDRQMDELQSDNPALAFTLARFMRIGTHLFWMREDDRILIASVPQVLLARLEHPGNSDLGEWLEEAGVDTASAGLFGAFRVDHAPRRNYYAYISALLAIADMLETDIDVQAFPTARELDLPETGTVGLAVDYLDGRLGATLAFENHPGDLFYAGGGSLAGIAVVGILAAVAIPAYQDYTVRAKLTAAYGSTSEFRSLLARHVAEQGRLPEATLAGDWAASIPLGPDVVSSYWQSEPPGLRLVLAGGAGVQDGAKLMISPRIEAGVITGWICSSGSIEDRHLPTECR